MRMQLITRQRAAHIVMVIADQQMHVCTLRISVSVSVYAYYGYDKCACSQEPVMLSCIFAPRIKQSAGDDRKSHWMVCVYMYVVLDFHILVRMIRLGASLRNNQKTGPHLVHNTSLVAYRLHHLRQDHSKRNPAWTCACHKESSSSEGRPNAHVLADQPAVGWFHHSVVSCGSASGCCCPSGSKGGKVGLARRTSLQ